MEQFSLEKYLENPTRKVVTRNGKTVRIICWDKLGEYPIIGCVKYSDDYEDLESYDINGFKYSFDREDQNDLFFADEEKELTEFEKALSDIIGFWQQGNYVSKDIKTDAKTLLYFARKEILKDLPKWKKCIGSTGPFIDYNSKGEAYLYLKDYVIKVSELFEKLPKEE